MQHETPTITAEKRERIGTRYAQRLRKEGRLPGVVYGHKAEPIAITVNEKEVITILKHGSHVMNLSIEGDATQTCLVKDIQFGYLGDNVIHIDFARVDLDEEVTVNVSLHFTGEPKLLKTPGSVMSHPMSELEVICRVDAIPDEIKVDLSEMETTFHVSEIQLPPGVRTEVDPHAPVAQITMVQEEEAEGEEVEVAEGAEPEVITEAKDDEEAKD
jgi:large subunit ribosomal protein L25